VRDLVARRRRERTILCVDRDLARVFDIDDATKVELTAIASRASARAAAPGPTRR